MARSNARDRAQGSLRSRLRASAHNALELARFGRLGADYGAPFEIVDEGPNHRLRRYLGAPEDAPVALLVPPLMITAEVYDIAPDVSAVRALVARGIGAWLVDFGAPERERGGMSRSLDDHVRAVARAIARVRELTGRDAHLCGYSQGGMFAYQTAAYLRGEGVRSIITFGSPVDIHKNLPAVRSDLAALAARSVFPAVEAVASRIEGLPGMVTSTAFKLVSPRKEVEQRIEFLRLLHDRERMAKRESRRRFIKGAGFVAWPAPAFRAFVEDFVVHNRMLSGGFVIAGRTVSLSDLTCPILAFVGETDDLARPATVRAIADAAPDADVRFVSVPTGHFGLVVGSRAMALTWPRVATWIAELERGVSPAEALPTTGEERHARREAGELQLLVDVVARGARDAWERLGETLASASATADTVRWQAPRLRRLARVHPDTPISVGRELARRAEETPDATFFLWHDRAFSYRDGDVRVTNVARGLYARGVRPGERVGVVMGSRPSLLCATTALVRLGAVPVVAPPDASPGALGGALARLGALRVIADPERAAAAARLGPEVLILGGGSRRGSTPLPPGAVDLEAIDPAAVPLPPELPLDPGRARDVAYVLLRPTDDGDDLRAATVTHHRWALSAIGAAAACTMKPDDTVFSAVPLHHPTGLLVSTGSALVGGARLALSDPPPPGEPIDARRLLVEVRRAGGTIVFFTGEMLRPLLDTPASRADRHLPVRMFAGSGMRRELAARIRERFGADTMEFYAGTTHRAILADARGREPGSLGDVLPGSAEVARVRCDLATRTRAQGPSGELVLAAPDEPGLLAARISEEEREALGDAPGLVANAFGDGATWLVTSDVLEEDAQGGYWFVDALAGYVSTPGGPVSLRRVEDALYALPEVRLVAAFEEAGSGAIAAAFVAGVPIARGRLEEALGALPSHARPSLVARVASIRLTDGFRPNKRDAARAVGAAREQWRLAGDRYEPA